MASRFIFAVGIHLIVGDPVVLQHAGIVFLVRGQLIMKSAIAFHGISQILSIPCHNLGAVWVMADEPLDILLFDGGSVPFDMEVAWGLPMPVRILDTTSIIIIN